jgi:tetratricopeptide (TPR) repeat protein
LTQAIQTRALRGEDVARMLFDRGVAFDALGNTKRALADYSAALRLAPRLSAALSNRANVYRRIGRLDEAKRDYLAALHCPGVSSQYPYYGLALIAGQLGDRDTARDYFQKALAVDPSYALAAQGLSALSAPSITSPGVPPSTLSAQEYPRLRPVQPKPATAHVITEVTRADLPKAPAKPDAPKAPLPATTRNEHLNLRQTISDVSESGHSAAAVQVQLGAFRDERSAMEAWGRISASAGQTLVGLHPIVVVVDLPGRGRFWRLRTSAQDKQGARKLCTELRANGQDCMLASD